MEALAAYVLLGITAGLVGGRLGEALSKRLGIMGYDFMKPWRREPVPDAGGAGLGVTLALVYALLAPIHGSLMAAAALLAAYMVVVGLVDDKWRMDPVTKPLLTMTAAGIIVLLGAYEPRVYIPLYGWASLRLVYPALLPLLTGVSANAFNMIDVVNGSMPTAALATLASIGIGAVVASAAGVYTPGSSAAAYTLILASALASYLLVYNRYPARVFNGDSGSLTVGALVGLAAIALKQEAVYLIAMSPLVLNGFQIVTTVRGFAERREIPRPVRVDEKGYLHATCDPRSPPTLVQLIVAEKPMREKEVYQSLLVLYALSSAAGIAAALLFYYYLPPA